MEAVLPYGVMVAPSRDGDWGGTRNRLKTRGKLRRHGLWSGAEAGPTRWAVVRAACDLCRVDERGIQGSGLLPWPACHGSIQLLDPRAVVARNRQTLGDLSRVSAKTDPRVWWESGPRRCTSLKSSSKPAEELEHFYSDTCHKLIEMW